MIKINKPFRTPFTLCRTESVNINGVEKEKYIPLGVIYCSCKSYGGTEKQIAGLYAIEDTIVIQTYYRDDITAYSVFIDNHGEYWKPYATPENIEMRNKFLQFKIKRITGE